MFKLGVNNLSAISEILSSLLDKNSSHLSLLQISNLSLTPIIIQSLVKSAYLISGWVILILPCLSNHLTQMPFQ